MSLTPPKNLAAVLFTPVNNFLAVSLTLTINFRLFWFFSEWYKQKRGNINCSPVSLTPVSLTPVTLTPVNNLYQFFTVVVDTAEQLSIGVVDTGDKH